MRGPASGPPGQTPLAGDPGPERANAGSQATSQAAAEAARYARRNVWGAIGTVVALFATVVAVGVAFEEPLLSFTRAAYRNLGLPGLLSLVFASDAITSPVPPDLVLLVIAHSELSERWLGVVTLAGTISIFAGNAGWLLGRTLGKKRSLRGWLERWQGRNRHLVERYGSAAVALGALTPLPFSITCWSAGALGMPWRRFVWVSTLRLPRYLLFYAIIAYAGGLAKLLQ